MVIGAFAMGADEFIVAGVVEPIAEDLNVTLGAVGLFESAYALGVAIGAPLFTRGCGSTGEIDRARSPQAQPHIRQQATISCADVCRRRWPRWIRHSA